MVADPIGALFLLALLVAVVHLLVSRFGAQRGVVSRPLLLVYLSTLLLANSGLLVWSEATEKIFWQLEANLIPALIFLTLLCADLRGAWNRLLSRFSKNKPLVMGCACSMGSKRYFMVLALALVVSFVVQIGTVVLVGMHKSMPVAMLLAMMVAMVLRLTPLRMLGGMQEVATTMLYMSVALFGMTTVLWWDPKLLLALLLLFVQKEEDFVLFVIVAAFVSIGYSFLFM